MVGNVSAEYPKEIVRSPSRKGERNDLLQRNPLSISLLRWPSIIAATLTGPMNRVTWYEAAAYCNWLSEQEGLDNSQWCYEPNSEGAYAKRMKIVPAFGPARLPSSN